MISQNEVQILGVMAGEVERTQYYSIPEEPGRKARYLGTMQ